MKTNALKGSGLKKGVSKCCRMCEKDLPYSDFPNYQKFLGKAKRYYTFYGSYCKSCEVIRVRRWKLCTRYGISVEEFDSMKLAQDSKCYLCKRNLVDKGKREEQFCIDHDHETGKVRSLLCWRCNAGLGMFEENPEVLAKAALYVQGKL